MNNNLLLSYDYDNFDAWEFSFYNLDIIQYEDSVYFIYK